MTLRDVLTDQRKPIYQKRDKKEERRKDAYV